MRSMRTTGLFLAISFLATAVGYTQTDDSWFHVKRSGTNPLTERRKWSTEHDKGKKSDAAVNLSALLNFKGGGTEPAALDVARNYVVIVGTDRWTDMYLLRTGCFSIDNNALEAETKDDCDLADTRIMNSPAVSIIGIKTFSASTTLEWDVTTKRRKRLDVLAFISYVLPSLAAGVLPAGADEYQYSVAVEPVAVKRLPADHEIAAKYTRNIGGQAKPEAFSRTYNNYGNEFVSFGVGAGVSKAKDVNLDFGTNALTANEITKLKTFGLIALHPQPIDPGQPRTWTAPYALAAIEISPDHLNYGGGVGWRLPFVNNTAIAVAWMNNLPDVADSAKGTVHSTTSPTSANSTRTWKATFMVHYTFPLPKTEKKQ